MKKTFALLVALMLLVAMLPTSAMAYTAVTPGNTNVTHTLSLSGLMTELEDGVSITYSFTVDSQQASVVWPEGGYKTPSMAVTGAPSISSITYDGATAFAAASKETPLVIDWSNVKIMEPGLYTWKVTKTCAVDGTTMTASNDKATFYVYALATLNGGNLAATATGISGAADVSSDKGNLNDQFPEKKVNLTVKKLVTGTMASVNQYFQFDITLNTLKGDYAIDVIETLDNNAYNDQTGTTNPQTVTVSEDHTKTTVTVWLKAGQTATIKDLPYGTGYNIVESGNEGFDVSADVEGDTDCDNTAATDSVVSDPSLATDTIVTYTNEKNAPTPTGVILNTAAPVMGILLALSLLAVLYIGKRKEYQA